MMKIFLKVAIFPGFYKQHYILIVKGLSEKRREIFFLFRPPVNQNPQVYYISELDMVTTIRLTEKDFEIYPMSY